MNPNFDENKADEFVNRIAATFAFGLPEHEQRRRIQGVLHEVFTLGRGFPHPTETVKAEGGVTIRKKKTR